MDRSQEGTQPSPEDTNAEHTPTPLTPEEQRGLEARQKATEYVDKRLDLTGPDGKPLPKDIAESRIREVQTEATFMLASQLLAKLNNEPIDPVQTETALLLSLKASDLAYRQDRDSSEDLIKKALDEIHRNNPLTSTGTLESVLGQVPPEDNKHDQDRIIEELQAHTDTQLEPNSSPPTDNPTQ